MNLLSAQPHDILCRILRECSTRSYDDDESNLSVKPETLRTFIDIMPAAVMSEVLKVGDSVFDSCYYRRPDLIARVSEFITRSRINAAKIGLYGDSLTSLRVWNNYSLPESERVEIIKDVLELILVPRGRQLLTLRTQAESVQAANFIAENCTRLCELELRTENSNKAYLEIILPKVGNTLRKLEHSSKLSRDQMTAIRNNCPNLNSLNILCAKGDCSFLADLLASYGENLKHAHLPLGFNVENVRTVVSECLVVELSVYVQEVSHLFISALSEHVVEIEVEQDDDDDDNLLSPSDAQYIFSKCNMLRKLTISHFYGSYVQPIWRNQNFEYPSTNHSVVYCLYLDYILTPFNLRFIAKSFSSLEDISLTMGTECFDDGLEELVARNKKLYKVHLALPITYHGTSENPTGEISQLGTNEVRMIHNTVEILSKCEKLRSLALLGYNDEQEMVWFSCEWDEEDLTRLRDLLLHSGLRRRNTFVKIMENQFLP